MVWFIKKMAVLILSARAFAYKANPIFGQCKSSFECRLTRACNMFSGSPIGAFHSDARRFHERPLHILG